MQRSKVYAELIEAKKCEDLPICFNTSACGVAITMNLTVLTVFKVPDVSVKNSRKTFVSVLLTLKFKNSI